MLWCIETWQWQEGACLGRGTPHGGLLQAALQLNGARPPHLDAQVALAQLRLQRPHLHAANTAITSTF